MGLKYLTIGLRPELYRYLEEHAKHEKVSIGRYMAMRMELLKATEDYDREETEGADEDVEPYSTEELNESIREAREAIEEVKSGKLKAYETTEELFQALGI